MAVNSWTVGAAVAVGSGIVASLATWGLVGTRSSAPAPAPTVDASIRRDLEAVLDRLDSLSDSMRASPADAVARTRTPRTDALPTDAIVARLDAIEARLASMLAPQRTSAGVERDRAADWGELTALQSLESRDSAQRAMDMMTLQEITRRFGAPDEFEASSNDHCDFYCIYRNPPGRWSETQRNVTFYFKGGYVTNFESYVPDR